MQLQGTLETRDGITDDGAVRGIAVELQQPFARDGHLQLGAHFVGHVLVGGDGLGGEQHVELAEGRVGALRAGGGFGDFLGDDAGRRAAEAVAHGQAVLEHVGRDGQGVGVQAGIDGPHHDGGDHLVLRAAVGGQHAGDVGQVGRHQLALECGLALVGLDAFQPQVVAVQGGHLLLVGAGAGHRLAGSTAGGLLLGQHPALVALGGGKGHGSPLVLG